MLSSFAFNVMPNVGSAIHILFTPPTPHKNKRNVKIIIINKLVHRNKRKKDLLSNYTSVISRTVRKVQPNEGGKGLDAAKHGMRNVVVMISQCVESEIPIAVQVPIV